ncbi:MAG: prolyl oligopeptidase family serine peptidase [Candidatus Marinimicrobia bacterium]|nr:prolyl oligopeptidase family serine peptidase [Candidatus Neomarinimicrobiota bacterium]
MANPIPYINESDPPFLTIHGDEGPLVPLYQSEILHKVLREQVVISELIVVPGGKHGPGVWEDKYIKKIISFFVEMKNKKIDVE